MRFHIITLGCPKNEVDSRGMERKLLQQGYRLALSPRQADVLIINTCGFIERAREESLKVAKEYTRKKKKGQRLIIAGCLPQLWGKRLLEEIPEADAFLGTRRWMEIGQVVEKLKEAWGEKIILLGDPEKTPFDSAGLSASWGSSAYLKISEGCSSKCAFCTIPEIKGPARSFPRQALVEEARRLTKAGVKELILVAQDTTAYGLDRGERDGLITLIEEILEAAPELKWLRIMYTSPVHITEKFIRAMSSIPQICHYLDMPLQHAHPDILRKMRRPYTPERVRKLIGEIRQAIPDIAIRTTFIVGYPGETEEAFQYLVDFVEEMAFDRVGIFIYSREEGTPAASLPDQVPEEVKEERYRRLMAVQQHISYRKNQEFVGKRLEILVEGYGEGLSVGRSYRDAPEIDGLVLVEGKLNPGEIVQVRIVKALEYDLVAEL
ncbi:MAG: 30S ribosomal protein S12 methylthiotransferase RimO [Anaerolineae bacterium]|nr:30S ribosomal protein S12 methylthiotransferase RimO [Anaerolineae bacterium]MDW8102681.1 30S ribosomal protein S12 methylthiotransferase RimO [Anaerolineae bacterium]